MLPHQLNDDGQRTISRYVEGDGNRSVNNLFIVVSKARQDPRRLVGEPVLFYMPMAPLIIAVAYVRSGHFLKRLGPHLPAYFFRNLPPS